MYLFGYISIQIFFYDIIILSILTFNALDQKVE